MESPGDRSDLPPLVRQVPPNSVASPSELRPRDGHQVRWYKPTVGETLTLMGWRWIYFLPAVGMILLLFVLPGFMGFQFAIIGWKLIVFAVVIPAGVFIREAKTVLRNRKEPFCIHCGYDLSGLQDNYNCPECGELYNFRLIEEYKRDPQWFIERYSMHKEIPVAAAPFEARKSTRPRSRDGT